MVLSPLVRGRAGKCAYLVNSHPPGSDREPPKLIPKWDLHGPAALQCRSAYSNCHAERSEVSQTCGKETLRRRPECQSKGPHRPPGRFSLTLHSALARLKSNVTPRRAWPGFETILPANQGCPQGYPKSPRGISGIRAKRFRPARRKHRDFPTEEHL